jgi:hypothetical protein
MRLERSDKFNKVRYAYFNGHVRVTQWQPSPAAAEDQLVGRLREGKIAPRGYDNDLRSALCAELEALGFVPPPIEGDVDEQVALTLLAMREQRIPTETALRFVQVATCTPDASPSWVFA